MLTAARDRVGGRGRLKTGSHTGATTKVQTGQREGQSLAVVMAREPFVQWGEGGKGGRPRVSREREKQVQQPGGENRGTMGPPHRLGFGRAFGPGEIGLGLKLRAGV